MKFKKGRINNFLNNKWVDFIHTIIDITLLGISLYMLGKNGFDWFWLFFALINSWTIILYLLPCELTKRRNLKDAKKGEKKVEQK